MPAAHRGQLAERAQTNKLPNTQKQGREDGTEGALRLQVLRRAVFSSLPGDIREVCLSCEPREDSCTSTLRMGLQL